MSIGDVNSDAKGSGARYNDGKPDVSLLPLRMLASYWGGVDNKTPDQAKAMHLMGYLGVYQDTQDATQLWDMLYMIPDAWRGAAQVFKFGAGKYAPWNWAKGMPWSQPLASAARHLLKILEEQEVADQESNLPHLWHVACNVVMLLQYRNTYTEGNDLPPLCLLFPTPSPTIN